MKDNFSTYHPFINLLFYCFVIGVIIFFMHPVFLIISFIFSLIYMIYLDGKKAILRGLAMSLPIMLCSMVINPLFTHEGNTILFYFNNGNPVTLESIVYGVVSGVFICIIILWFYSFHFVMSSDKYVYLFGKILPSLSLLISMILRFVPRFQKQMKRVLLAQKGIGKGIEGRTWKQKLHDGMRILSIMLTWSLENSVETADSMKSRGYGLRGRTSFHNYCFEWRDLIVLIFMFFVFSWTILGIITKKIFVLYYPLYMINDLSLYAIISYMLYGCLCALPMILNILEDVRWLYLKSKI